MDIRNSQPEFGSSSCGGGHSPALPDDRVCAVAARDGRGLLPRGPEKLQRRVDVHFCGVFDGELHHL